MKQIPNIFTLLNLVCGCIAITLIFENGMIASFNEDGAQFLQLPEKFYWASLFIGLAAVIDFLDGFVARLLKASSEMGKQLDSLADVVSFGVAPAMISYQFLRLSFAQNENGLDTSTIWLLPAFIVPCAGAYRLARFNINPTYSVNFSGVPIPAVGLLFASFPLIYWFSNETWALNIILNSWFWYALISITSYLMVSNLPMLGLKFADLNFKNNLPKILLLVTALVAALLFGWLAVPLVFTLYVMLSLLVLSRTNKEATQT